MLRICCCWCWWLSFWSNASNKQQQQQRHSPRSTLYRRWPAITHLTSLCTGLRYHPKALTHQKHTRTINNMSLRRVIGVHKINDISPMAALILWIDIDSVGGGRKHHHQTTLAPRIEEILFGISLRSRYLYICIYILHVCLNANVWEYVNECVCACVWLWLMVYGLVHRMVQCPRSVRAWGRSRGAREVWCEKCFTANDMCSRYIRLGPSTPEYRRIAPYRKWNIHRCHCP